MGDIVGLTQKPVNLQVRNSGFEVGSFYNFSLLTPHF